VKGAFESNGIHLSGGRVQERPAGEGFHRRYFPRKQGEGIVHLQAKEARYIPRLKIQNALVKINPHRRLDADADDAGGIGIEAESHGPRFGFSSSPDSISWRPSTSISTSSPVRNTGLAICEYGWRKSSAVR